MCLLKKGVPFYWGEVTQCSFEVLKSALVSTPLLIPLDYGKDLLLYLVATESTIDMVLVQEDDVLKEHIIYYLIRGLIGPEHNYTHVEKLALTVVHTIQIFVIIFYCIRPLSWLSSIPFNMF
jgi:hypothetical protein